MSYLLNTMDGSPRICKWSLSAPESPELRTLDNHIDDRRKTVAVFWEPLLDFGEQRFIRELHLPAEGVAQQFAAELAEDGLTTLLQEVIPQAFQTVDSTSVGKVRAGVDGAAGEITLTAAADGIKALQREAERVDPLVA